MLTFFPTPYPDELLYSVLARYHIRSGNPSPRVTLMDLFGLYSTSAIVDLPTNINLLVSRMPLNAKFTVSELINEHTLYPYYAPFMFQKKAYLVYKSMVEEAKGRGGGLTKLRTGINASKVVTPNHLRFCPVCIKEDTIRYGEAYWHRLHQIPGVFFCLKHQSALLDSQVNVSNDINKYDYIAPSNDTCIVRPNIVSYDRDLRNKLLILARDSEWILNSGIPTPNDDDYYSKKYNSILMNKGFATYKGTIKHKDFKNDFVDYYGAKFLESVYSMVNDNKFCWLISIAKKHENNFHPLRHLLLIRYLVGDPQTFFEKDFDYKPFGDPPWPCQNIAADHYLQPIIKNVKISYDGHSKRIIGTFSCSCGYVYSRNGPDLSEEDKYRKTRVKVYGPLWESKVKQLVEKDKLSYYEIARQLNVDKETAKKYAQKDTTETVVNKKKKNAFDEKEFELLRDQKRAEWIQLIKENKGLSRTELSRLNFSLYGWLYRYDKKWLNSNVPTMENNLRRVDWEQRDVDILLEVKTVVNEILKKEGRPERITINRISKKIGKKTMLNKNIDKLPMTKEYLSRVTESVEDHRERRVKWAAKELHDNGEEVKKWKIRVLAGLPASHHFSTRIASVIKAEEIKYSDSNIVNSQ